MRPIPLVFGVQGGGKSYTVALSTGNDVETVPSINTCTIIRE